MTNSSSHPPVMNLVDSLVSAENFAGVIYNLSEQCFMAHTLRAVECHITREYNKTEFPIILVVEDGVQSRWNSKSWSFPTGTCAYIWVDEKLDRDQMRVCIAHEAYHIIEYFRPTKSSREHLEEVCDKFANELCTQHDAFYKNPEKVKKCEFGRLPINSKRH
jgi:hypothetical protein